jgi:hypothetical protein
VHWGINQKKGPSHISDPWPITQLDGADLDPDPDTDATLITTEMRIECHPIVNGMEGVDESHSAQIRRYVGSYLTP